MKVATIRLDGGTRAVRIDDDAAIDLGATDVRELLQRPDWEPSAAAQTGKSYPLAGLDYAPVVPNPEKIICVGLNYRQHIIEMGRDLPEYPTLFAKFARSLVGAYDDITLPASSSAVDWEAELAIVVGATVRNADRETAGRAIAGYTVLNDVTGRDWQYRTTQWLQGKTFEASTPIGPWLVTDDARLEAPNFDLSCTIDGEVMQSAKTGDLVFGTWDLVSYISSMITLVPGDIIATGTPGGVGHARKPPRYLQDGHEVVTRIDGVGECRNICRGGQN